MLFFLVRDDLHIYEELTYIQLPSNEEGTNLPSSFDNDPEIEMVPSFENIYEEIKLEKDDQGQETSPTANDTILHRFSEFLLYCVAEFNQKACLVILVSTDKSNAKTSKFSKYLNKAVDTGVTAGIAQTVVGAGAAKGAGKMTGELVEGLIKKYEENKQHKKSKLTEHLLKTFQPDDPEWILFLLDGFSTIFIW